MAQVPDVGKLRPVLDYLSCETCLETFDPHQDYLCRVCVKLHREVTVKQTAMARDEAVQVIAPEDFHMARGLRDRIQQQELELQDSRARLKKLTSRENELTEKLEDLQKQLEETKKEKEAATLVPFELVGVKEATDEAEEMLEFAPETEEPAPAEAAAPAFEPVPDETPTTEPQWETVPETEPFTEGEEPAAFQSGPAPSTDAPVPPAQQRVRATDDAIARIEDEIGKIEAELTQLADQEKDLQKKSRVPTAKKSRRSN